VTRARVPAFVAEQMLGTWQANATPRTRSFVAAPNTTSRLVYGCLAVANACVWYAKGIDQIIGQIAGLRNPVGIGVNPRNGDVYIANSGAADILVYPPNSTTLIAVLDDPDQIPVDVAVDGAGNVFVANNTTVSGGAGTVAVYIGGATSPTRLLSDPNVFEGLSVAVDEHNLLAFCFYSVKGTGECDTFPRARGHGNVAATGLSFPGGSSFDAAEHLVVEDQTNYPTVYTFADKQLCGAAPLTDSRGPSFGVLDRGRMRGATQTLYSPDPNTPAIWAYPYTDCLNHAVSPVRRYHRGIKPSDDLVGAAITPGEWP